MATITKVSPLAPAGFTELPAIDGVRLATVEAGVRYQGRTDVMLALMHAGTSVAGVFTRSATRAAPVLDCQDKIGGPNDGPAAILVNSGNANAFTGHYGQTSVAELTQAVAQATGVPVDRVFTSSTGVIGEPLPHDRIVAQLETLNGDLRADALEDAARAIMTTDTFPKGASAQVEIDGKTVSVSGIAKGSGMIAPDMATMLVYIFTDAKIEQSALQRMLAQQTDRTFNCITVDSDTSTSDSLLLCATGASGVDATGNAAFAEALESVMLDLAQQVVRDGEGATKFVEIRVTGAASDSDAKIHGLAIANSPLVKTAIAGEDPNWGRVVMAIGKSGAAADRDLLSISFGNILVAENGWVSPDYREDDAAAYMQGQNLVIAVDLGLGSGTSTVWTCDLTHGYIEINADYRS
ncbi:MAG: bifunctional glutamate N-acetyltransferase/amino-acid acetyltransferase ArgJ [Ruegeria sp.]